MADGVTVDTSELEHYGHVLAAAGPQVEKAMRTALTRSGDEMLPEVIRVGAASMPKRGGLAAKLAGAHGGITVKGTGSTVEVSLEIEPPDGIHLALIDDSGLIFHPVWGNRSAWSQTTTGRGVYAKATADRSSQIAAGMRAAIESEINHFAREA